MFDEHCDEQCYSLDIMLHPATDSYTSSTACSQPKGMAWEVGYYFWVSLQNGVRATHLPCGKEYMFQLGRLNRPNQPSASCKNYKIHLHTFFSSVIQNPLNHLAPCVPFLVLISQNVYT